MSKKKKNETDQQVETVTADEVNTVGSDTAATDTSETKVFTMTAEEMETARNAVEQLKKEKDETIALLQRNQADFDNYRRRNASVRLDSLEEGKRNCISELLPVLDNFDRAMEQCGDEPTPWQEGIILVQKQLMETLSKLGLNEIETDCKFDPVKHEAVMQEAADGKESGDILAVFQKGYRVGDKIIRPSMVKVAQ